MTEAEWKVQREKNLVEMKRKAECRRAWNDAIAAAAMIREGKTPPAHLTRFWGQE